MNRDRDSGTPRTILVVEDDESLSILIQRRLNREGFVTEGVPNGSDALGKIADKRYGLLLLDYTLPDMSGHQFVRKLQDLNYDIPFVVTTGQANEAIVSEMMELGARGYLVKNNAFLDSLPGTVRAILDKQATPRATCS
jgi:DNA-binding response OmpR family regulator